MEFVQEQKETTRCWEKLEATEKEQEQEFEQNLKVEPSQVKIVA
jgi:hypothetical protein